MHHLGPKSVFFLFESDGDACLWQKAIILRRFFCIFKLFIVANLNTPFSGIVLGGFYSKHRGVLEMTRQGTAMFEIVTEDNNWGRGIVLLEDMEGCRLHTDTVRGAVVVMKLRSCSGVITRYVNPAVEERATILIDVGSEASGRAAFTQHCAAMYSSVPNAIVQMLVCKLRLIRARHEATSTRNRVLHFRGEGLASLSDKELLAHQAKVVAAMKRLNDSLDSLWEDRLVKHLCLCCTERPANTLLLPCKHLVLCKACLDGIVAKSNYVTCPVCRGDIEDHCGVFTSA